ncbi:MAG: hypothetical protein EKK46_00470 [Rhodocyclaceae bacterium]|nr:MAG: hypothetical protein EKK46_00470 [Rhodocyclaceae bacterium]
MKKTHPPVHQIEVRIGKLSELFNSMDPTPFHHRDLDNDAEEFLESWAMEFPHNSHFRIIVHIEQMPEEDPTPVVAEAIHNYFDYQAMLTKRNLSLLLLEGRTSLLIGLGFLALCLFGADILSSTANGNTFLRVARESLIIGGWVAMWRPMQIFLYEWWPLVRKGNIYRHLGHASVHVLPVST